MDSVKKCFSIVIISYEFHWPNTLNSDICFFFMIIIGGIWCAKYILRICYLMPCLSFCVVLWLRFWNQPLDKYLCLSHTLHPQHIGSLNTYVYICSRYTHKHQTHCKISYKHDYIGQTNRTNVSQAKLAQSTCCLYIGISIPNRPKFFLYTSDIYNL